MCAPEDEDYYALLGKMVAESSDMREARMRNTISSWTPADLQANADALSEAIQSRVVTVQTAAIAEHDRGGDTTSAQKELQALVDMMVYSKILVRNAKLEIAIDD